MSYAAFARHASDVIKPFKSMPGPKGWPLIGTSFDYGKNGKFTFEKLHESKMDRFKEFGHIYKESFGPRTFVQIFDPEDVKKVFHADGKMPLRPAVPITLVADKRDNLKVGLGSLNGEPWYALRRAVQRLMLHPRAAGAYLPLQIQVAEDFVEKLKDLRRQDGEIDDLAPILRKYAMESIAAVCYNKRLGCLEENNTQAQTMLQAVIDLFLAIQKSFVSFPWHLIYRDPIYREFKRCKILCDEVGMEHFQRANKSLEDGDSERSAETGCPFFMATLMKNAKNLTETQIIGIVTDLFTAGIDSTANSLSFVIYNLARHPDKQAKLQEEIDQYLGKGQPILINTIEKMAYLRACVRESFRLNYPIEGGTTRILSSDLELGGYLVPKNTLVAMNNQTMCLQEEFIDQPHEFIPERFLKDNNLGLRPIPPFLHLPFGYGARMCIGRRFAEQEVYLAMIKIFQNLSVSYDKGEIQMINRIFTTMDRPLTVKIQTR